MKKILSLVIGLLFIASFAVAGVGPYPNKQFGESLGKDGRSYNDLYLKDSIYFEGATSDGYETTFFVTDPTADNTITFQDGTGTVAFTTDVSTAATAWSAITSPSANKTHAFTTYTSLFTGTSTAADQWVFDGQGAFGNYSVMRIQSSTGNPTDGTVLEVVSHDANVDPFVVSALTQAGVLTVGQGGTVSVIGATDITGAFGVTGASTLTGALTVTGTTAIGDDSATVAIDSSDWNISTAGAMTGIDAITMDGLLTAGLGATISGAIVNLNASSPYATNINTGNSAGALTLGGGSGTVAVNSSDWDISTAGAMTGIGAVTMDGLLAGTLGATITGATVNLNAASNFAVNVATGNSTGTVTIGGTGIQAIDIGNGAAAKTVALGSLNTTSTTTLLSGSGGINLNVDNNQPTNIGSGTTTGAIAIGGTGAQTLNIGNGAGVKTVNLGSVNTNSPTTIYSGVSAGPLLINSANGTATTGIGTGNTTGAVTIGGNSNTVAVASTTWDVSAAGAFTGVTGITMAPGVANTITQVADSASDDLTISTSGAVDTSLVLSSTGTAANALDVKTTAGGMLFTASGAMADQFKVSAAGTIAGNAVNVVTTDGGIVLTAGGAANGDITLTGGDAIALNATGTVAITSADWGISATGALTKIASVSFDNSAVIYNTTVACDNACIKALQGTPLALVATPGADKFIELVSAVLILNYGTNVLSESEDNLVIEYTTSGQDATAAIEATGFIDAAADQMAIIRPLTLATVAAASLVNNGIRLTNTGDGEYAGNIGADTTLSIRVSYRVHTAGL